jgi:hypothetical protein
MLREAKSKSKIELGNRNEDDDAKAIVKYGAIGSCISIVMMVTEKGKE